MIEIQSTPCSPHARESAALLVLSCPVALLFTLRHTQERFIEWVNTHENVHWVPMVEMAREFRRKNKPAARAKMPSGYEEHN
jgi:predicted secreted Zn-dependent protease